MGFRECVPPHGKMDRAVAAGILAGLAHHALMGEAVLADRDAEVPGRCRCADDRRREDRFRTDLRAGAAEAARPRAESKVNNGTLLFIKGDNAFRTGRHAGAAAGAAIREDITQRPGRPEHGVGRRFDFSAEQEGAS